MSWFVYIIETTSGRLYTGITTDIERRFKEHCSSKKGAKFFRSNTPKEVVYSEAFENRSLASKREWEIKQFSRAKKLELIHSSIGPS